MWKEGWVPRTCWGIEKLWSMKVTVIPLVIGALGTDTKELVQGLEDLEITGRVETTQTTASLRLARILRRVLETWRDFCHSNSSKKPSANAGVKNSHKWTNDNNNKGNSANCHRKCIRLDTNEWARWSTGRCARNLNLTVRTNGICTNQNLSWRIRGGKLSKIFKYRRIT